MTQRFDERVKRLLKGQWSHILKKPLKGCKTPINEVYLDLNQRILWMEVLEGADIFKSLPKNVPPSDRYPKMSEAYFSTCFLR